MNRKLFFVKRQLCMLLPGMLVLTLLLCHLFSGKVLAAEQSLVVQTEVYHQHQSDCYTDTRCGGSCKQVEYFLQGCDCGPGHPCSNHGCYWEDPNDLYPSGCWHCYCPKGTTWKCTKCGRKSSGSSCDNGDLKITCGKSGVVTARITVEKATAEWCTQLELRATVELDGAELSETPYVWDGTPSVNDVYNVTENGIHTFELQADEYSNTAGAKIEIQVNNIDVTGPQIIAYEQEPADGWTKEPAKLIITDIQDLQPDGSAGCGLAELPLAFDGGEWTSERVFICADSGTYPVKLIDALGNIGEAQVKVTGVDVTGPTVHFEWDQTPNLPRVWIDVIAEDIQKDGTSGSGLAALPYSYDGGQTWTDQTTFEVEDNGSYPVLVKDKLGNITEAVVEVGNLDKTGPVVTAEVTPEKWDGKSTATITVNAADAGCGLAELPYSWDGGQTWTDEDTKEVEKAGTYTVTVQDKNGNTTELDVVVKKYTAGNNGSGNGGNGSGDSGDSGDSGNGGGNGDSNGGSDAADSDGNSGSGGSDDSADSGSDKDGNDSSDSDSSDGTDDGSGSVEDGDTGSDGTGTENGGDGSGNSNSGAEDGSDGRSGKDNDGSGSKNGSGDDGQKRRLSSLTGENLGEGDGLGATEAENENGDADDAGSNDEDDSLTVEENTVKEEEALASGSAGNRTMIQILQENPAKAVTIAASTALLISVIGLLLFLLLMGIRVYHEDENGQYRLLGMRICRRKEGVCFVTIPRSMTEKDESGRFRICPGALFASLNQDEDMLVEIEEEGHEISVRISRKMDFRL